MQFGFVPGVKMSERAATAGASGVFTYGTTESTPVARPRTSLVHPARDFSGPGENKRATPGRTAHR